jgi:hypothetical protein
MDREPHAQPLDRIMNELGLANNDLVKASTEQLTHKMVQKGRKGKKLTPNIQSKIQRALNQVHTEKSFSLNELFDY